ncbi:hypothetical protein [Polaromonas naphthalenivorans]|uniref:Putative signal peptide protein n=1 Tax=Polaromonas naphthalenivorans (strain CJ2) TaxID=365044 RepID=A1VNS3_POLNA|nr:hypothetical protein [Polaromonas naphthalenivorans]ABM37301.1 putative signal peptide protein [Polaromonas naphthalenivorans CJ2]
MMKILYFGLKKKTLLIFSVTAICALTGAGSGFAQVSSTPGSESSALLEKHEVLKPQLAQNSYRRPLFFESTESANTVSSSVYAVLDSPFPTVSMTFKKPDRWCEVLILHLNTKYCQASADADKSGKLAVNIGKKTAQALADTFSLEFSHRVTVATPNYLAVQLHADKGPLKTTDYQLQLLAVPLPEGKTFINLRYSYGYGLAGRLAMQTYLSTLGRGKVGFTKSSSGETSGYVGGMRGAVERNTMRYYLAIEAYLASLKQPPAEQVNSRLQYWFDATEEYALQLHELDQPSYLSMKKAEYQRQQGVPVTVQ